MDKVTFNSKEQKQLVLFNEMLAGRMAGQGAAVTLGLSLHHRRRLLAN